VTMMQEAHISRNRMHEVVYQTDAVFTSVEEDHIRRCKDCLQTLTELLLDG